MAYRKQNQYYDPINPYTGFSQGNTSNDILYNLGGLLGAIWANNYNQRGIEKGMNTAGQILGDSSASFPTDATIGDSVVGAKNVDDLYNNVDMSRAIGSNVQQQGAGIGPISAAIGAGQQPNAISAGQQQDLTAGPIAMATGAGQMQPPQNTLTVGGTQLQDGNFQQPRTVLNNGYVSNGSNVSNTSSGKVPTAGSMTNDIGTVAAAQQMGVTDMIPRDLKAEKLDYIAGKYDLSDNPDGDRAIVGLTADKLKTNLGLINLSGNASTDPEAYKAAIRMQLMKDGRTSYQIEQIMKTVDPAINSKINGLKEQQFMNLYNTYKQQVQAGEIDQSALTYAKMKQLNPVWAEGLSGQFKRNQMDFLNNYEMQKKIERYMTLGGLDKQRATNMALYNSYYSPQETAQMGVFAGSVGGRSRGGGGGYSSGGTGYGRVGSSRVSGGAASKEGTYVSGLGYVKYGSQSHKDIQQEYDKLAEAGNNLSPTQKKRMENLGYILEQIDNSITKGIPASYEDYVAKAKNLIGQGVSKEQALAGLDPDSSAYQSLSKAYDDAAWEQQQDFNEREAENARSKEASQKQAAQAQEAAQEEYDATHRHGLIKMFDDAGGFFGWVRGTRDRVFGR